VVVVIPPIGLKLRKRKALIVVNVIGRLVGAPSEQYQARQHASHDPKGFLDTA
jgi:hypothetical protein